MTYRRVMFLTGMAVLAGVLMLVAQGLFAKADPSDTQASTATVNYGSGTWTGPTSSVRRTGNPATAHVLMIGDSITNGCTPALVKAFAARGKTLAVIAQSGQNSAGLVSLLKATPALPPDVLFAGGANDVYNPPAMAKQISDARAYVTDHGSELWALDTYVARTRVTAPVRESDLANSGWVNGQIYAGVEPGHTISAVAALRAAVSRGRTTGYYLRDGLHYWEAAGTGHGDGCAFLAYTAAAGVK